MRERKPCRTGGGRSPGPTSFLPSTGSGRREIRERTLDDPANVHFGLFVASALALGFSGRRLDRRNLLRLAGAGLLSTAFAPAYVFSFRAMVTQFYTDYLFL